MKFKKKLYYDLLSKYILFLVTTVIATILFLGTLVYLLLGTISKEPELMEKRMNMYINGIEYNNITEEFKISIPLDENTWVEIVKDNKVVFVKGNKQDDKQEYTQQDLALIINNMNGLINKGNLSYGYIPFEGTDGENYICLLKAPKEKIQFKLGMDTPPELRGTDLEKEINFRTKITYITFFITIMIIILFISRITSRKIIRPIKELNNGLENVINGDYSVKLNFKGNYEFEELRDKFNYMAERLKNVERENKRITESKKRLLLDISHDLRTPATTIQGYSEALCSDLVENEEKKKKYLKYIYEKSKRVTDLIETLFKYSKLESSVYDLNREINDIAEFMRNVVINFYGELEEKDFKIDVQIPDRKIMYNFDKIELERSLANIIGNIIKYNPEGTTFTIYLEEYNNNIEIIIGDNGIGIPENIQKNVFNALVRGDNTRKTDGGMGLGLAIAKKVIELHGGNITLESKAGEGSKFYIKFKR